MHNIIDFMGEREIAVCKELTKLNEHIFRGTTSEILEILSNLGSFTRPYMTKGLRVWYRGGHRDLDVQFCFDKTPEQWRMKQYRGFGGRARQKNGMRTDFLYAVLLEG